MRLNIFAGSDPTVADEDLSKIEIDKDYARRLEHNKKREDLHRYQELKKKGLVPASDNSEDDESSSDDESDSDLAASRKDLKFLEGLLRVKKQDPILTQQDVKIFDSEDESDEDEESKEKKKKKEKPIYLKDVNYNTLMEEEEEPEENKKLKNQAKVYNKDQEENIRAFIEAEKEAFDSVEGEDIIKEKKRDGGDDMEEDNNAGEIEKKWDEFFEEDEKLDEGDRFLKNYLKDKMWVDREKEKKLVLFHDIGVSEDEDELDKQDKYEAEYNFRHEEVDGDRILGHARVTEGSVRKKMNSRTVQRKHKEERTAQAEFERKEELKHLKNLKKREIQEKLEKVRAIAGLGEERECRLGADDLEEDFNPEEYDRKMREMFGEDYYGAEDADPGFGSDEDAGLEKPDFDKEDELLGLPKDWDVSGADEGFKATREKMLKQKEEEEEPEEKESKRKRKRKMTLREKVEIEKELEEYYKLDYEDTIGDLKTRFKYKPVAANKFGLGTAEILMADDKDLNQYVSLKRLAPYTEKEWEVTHHQKAKKDSILFGEKSDGSKSKKRHEMKAETSVPAEADSKGEENEETTGDASNISRRKRRRQRQKEIKLKPHREMAYGKTSHKPYKKK